MRARTRITALITLVTAATVAVPVAAGDKVGGGPDESPAQAQPIAQNKVVAGAFQGSKDYFDYYSFTAQAGQTLKFTLTDTTSSCSGSTDAYKDGCPVYGWLADASNQQLGGPNSAAGGNTSVGKNGAYPQQASWTWKFSQAGTYYIGLQDDAGPAIPKGTPTYTIEYTGTSSTTSKHRRKAVLQGVHQGGNHAYVIGYVKATDRFDRCAKHVPVIAQRRAGTRWSKVGSGRTGAPNAKGRAKFNISVPLRSGTYRALVPRHRADSLDVCLKAISDTKPGPPGH
jgi:hypothetical protein